MEVEGIAFNIYSDVLGTFALMGRAHCMIRVSEDLGERGL